MRSSVYISGLGGRVLRLMEHIASGAVILPYVSSKCFLGGFASKRRVSYEGEGVAIFSRQTDE